MRAREGRRGRARRLEAKGGRDGEGPVGGGPQGEALELDGETERNSQPPTSSQRVLNVSLTCCSCLFPVFVLSYANRLQDAGFTSVCLTDIRHHM